LKPNIAHQEDPTAIDKNVKALFAVGYFPEDNILPTVEPEHDQDPNFIPKCHIPRHAQLIC
jgi:hypothetical protein